MHRYGTFEYRAEKLRKRVEELARKVDDFSQSRTDGAAAKVKTDEARS